MSSKKKIQKVTFDKSILQKQRQHMLTKPKSRNFFLWEPLSESYHRAQTCSFSKKTHQILQSSLTIHSLQRENNDLFELLEKVAMGLLIIKLSRKPIQADFSETHDLTEHLREMERGIELLESFKFSNQIFEEENRKKSSDLGRLHQLQHGVQALGTAFGAWLIETNEKFLKEMLLTLRQRRTRSAIRNSRMDYFLHLITDGESCGLKLAKKI